MCKKGQTVSEETRRKISLSLRGHRNNVGWHHSEETKAKMRKPKSPETIQKFRDAQSRRKPISEETKNKIRLTLTGRRLSESVKEKLRGKTPWNKGLKGLPAPKTVFTAEGTSGSKNVNWKGGLPKCVDCGNSLSDYREGGRCRPCYRKFNKGENHYKWTGGPKSEIMRVRTSTEYKQWKQLVHRRDLFTCQMPKCDFKGKEIEAHHIVKVDDKPELILDVSNGITLCKKCHAGIRHKEKEYEKMFCEIVATPKRTQESREIGLKTLIERILKTYPRSNNLIKA